MTQGTNLDDIAKAYYEVLKSFKDSEIKNAGYLCLEECTFFPKPKEIIDRIASATITAHDKEIMNRYTCPKCGTHVSVIIEGVCWDCHNGVPISAGRRQSERVEYQTEDRDYVILPGAKCATCGKENVRCIKEPAFNGEVKCRECYTGLSGNQYKQRLNDLAVMMGDKAFIPEWVKGLARKCPKTMSMTKARIERKATKSRLGSTFL
jgi:transcription elongation factor Elf1